MTGPVHERYFEAICLSAILLICFWINSAAGNPEHGIINAGQATIAKNGNTTTIVQTTDKAVINWQSFNIASHETTRFVQPSANSITLNRVNPDFGASQIHGILAANGNIWILNPAGIVFGHGAQVNVGGLLATTADISNEDFQKGNYQFKQNQKYSGSVINNGMITVRQGGMAALVAPGVENNGIIQAQMGKVALAAGNAYTVDLHGDNLIHFGVNSEITEPGKDLHGRILKDAVANTGKIIANGGKVLLTVSAAKNIVENSINVSGTIHAKSAFRHSNGSIVLSGGDNNVVKVTGELNASGKISGQKGGVVKISGEKILLTGNAKIDVSGDSGGGKISIGGGKQGKDTSIKNSQETLIGNNVQLLANALSNGNGGEIIVWSDGSTQFLGKASARGGAFSGNGGFVETSGKENLYIGENAFVDTLAPHGKAGDWLLDPRNITIAASGTATLADVNSFSTNPGTDRTIAASTINNASSNVVLQANNDITFNSNINMVNEGVGLTAQAGRDINLSTNINITTFNGDVNFTANDHNAVAANRSTGTGDITMGTGSSINTGAGKINLTIDQNGVSAGSISARDLTTSGVGTINLSSPNTITLNGVITSGGAVTLNANTKGSGTNSFTMAAGSSINTNNAAVNINVNAANGGTGAATLRDINTNGGALNVATNTGNNTTGGSITQVSGTTLQTGSANLSTGSASITLNNNNNFAGAVAVKTQGATSDATLRSVNTSGIKLASSSVGRNLTINASGPITQTGAITVPGTATLVAGAANDITLTHANNFFSTVAITSGNNISLNNSAALNLGTSTVSGNLNIITQGALTDSGNINVANGRATFNTNGNDITLNNTNRFSTIKIVNANNVTLSNSSNALIFDTANIGGNLTVTSGALSQTGALTVNGTASFNAGSNAISLNNADNNFNGPVNLTNSGANNISLVNNGDLILASISMGNSAGTLTIDTSAADGSIKQANGTIITTGTGAILFKSGAAEITLANDNNFRGNISVMNSGCNDVVINKGVAGTLLLANIDAGGNFTAQSIDAITVNGSIASNSGNINFNTNTNGAGNNSFTMAASSSITTNNKAVNIQVNSANGGTGSATLRDINTHGGTLTVATNHASNLTGGAITQSTGTSLNTGDANFSTGNASITLNNNNNFSGNVGVNAQGNSSDVTLRSISGINLDTSFVNRNLTINSNGAITQTGDLTVNGTSKFNTTDAPIMLTQDNILKGTVTITNTGISNDVVINTLNTLKLGTSTIGGDFCITAGDGITLSGNITSGGEQTFNSTVELANNITLTGSIINMDSSLNGGYNLVIRGDALLDQVGTNTALRSLTINGDSVLNGNIKTTSNQVYNGNLTLNCPDITLSSNANITFNGNIEVSSPEAYSLSLNTGNQGDITFNGDVGSQHRLDKLIIENAENVYNNALVKVNSFIQLAGTNLTSLGSYGLDAAEKTLVTTKNVTGKVTTNKLVLDTQFANLTGSIAGSSGKAGAKKIIVTNNIQPETHYFDNYDLTSKDPEPTPPTPPSPAPTPQPPAPAPLPDVNSLTLLMLFPFQYENTWQNNFMASEKIENNEKNSKAEIQAPQYPISDVAVEENLEASIMGMFDSL